MKKHLYTLAILIVSSVSVFSQTQKAFLKAADDAFAEKNYYGALKWYSEALEFEEDNTDIIYKLAESAREFDAYDLAAEKYKLLVDSLGGDKYPDAAFRLGEMLQKSGDYENSKQYYNMYLSEYSGTDSLKRIKAQEELKAVDFAIGRMADIDKSASLVDIEAEVNTPFSEFGAIKKDSALYFTTMKYAEEGKENRPARSISKIHTLVNDSNTLLESDINQTNQLVAHTVFNRDGSTVYYTLCDYINAEDVRCVLFTRPVMPDGSFGSPTKLPSPINMDSTTTTHPYIAYDSLVQKEILYFVSDRVGGKGKLDIYTAVINENGSYDNPVNLEQFNTEGNDVTPFLHGRTGTFYFSSDGRLGLGGYDIYHATKGKDGFGEVQHARIPVNSSYHDLYYTLDDWGEEGYFSSNRKGATFVDSELKACCFDIFKVEYDEVILDLSALVFDELSQEPLNGATMFLIDTETGDTINQLTNIDGNDFSFKVRKDREYDIVVQRPFYNTKIVPLSTKGITESKTIDKKIYLKTDRMQLKLEMFNKRTKEELAGVQITVKNLTTGKIDTVAVNELGNDFVLYPELGYKYEIQASKFGFVTETLIVDLTNEATPGVIEKKMYLEVFDIEDYMPVFVYFENDQPNPRSKSTATNAIYGDLFKEYMNEKATYMKKHTKKMSGQQKIEGEARLDNFFEGDVVGGYDKLKRFMRALKKELELGRNLEIAIKGYASPLADKRYNLALGQRRVRSVVNELMVYEGGYFKSFIDSGRLIVTDISFGEETSPKEINDRSFESDKSIYSVEASKERRVQIVKITDQ